MTATYCSDHAADPELYERLMRERYGPLPKVMAERKRPRPPAPARSPLMTPAPRLDPDATVHYAQLQQAIVEAAIGRPRPILATKPERTPPVPGAVWCNSCDTWCTPQGMCHCNNR